MKIFLKINLLLIFLIFSQPAKGQQAQYQEQIITPGELEEWVSYISSDQMKGRSNGSAEMKVASEWIAARFKESGLQEFSGFDGLIQNYSYSYRQKIINERNVIGYIEGADPDLRDEFIVISAHFDHIGIIKGNAPDSICNGADDNASGISTILGIAKWIKESGTKPGRSIIFAAFSGEEHGMRGSRYFVSGIPVPFKNIYANLNFEMTGHSEFLGRGKYYMTGCLYSNLDDAIGDFIKNTGYELVDSIAVANSLFNSSDNIAFSRISLKDGMATGIPSGTFATTSTSEYLHNTTDEADLFDFENMADLVNHFSKVVVWLSNTGTEIVWTDHKFRRPE